MMTSNATIKTRFDKAAEHYDRFAKVQQRAAHRLAALAVEQRVLDDGNASPATLVEVGCGTGFLTEILCRRFKSSRFHALDIAPAMIHHCAQRLAHYPQLSCHCVDAQAPDVWQSLLSEPSDWLISNLCLQWTCEWRTSLTLWARHARRVIFSVPVHGSFTAWSQAHQQAGYQSGLYPLPALEAVQVHCQQLGRLIHFDCQVETLHYPNPLDFARHFRGLGAHQPRPGHQPVALRRVLKHLPNGINADYRIAYAMVDMQ